MKTHTPFDRWFRSSGTRLLPWFLLLFAKSLQAQFTIATNNGTVTITGYTGTSPVVVIPSSTNGYAVTSIGDSAFQGNTLISNVTIPSAVTNIGNNAFYSCQNLTNASMGNGVLSIGSLAFGRCSSIATVVIPASVTTIGASAFVRCSALTSIAVDGGNAAYSSADGVLFDKNRITLVQFPGGIAESYLVPDTVHFIGRSAFQYCQLTGLTIPDSVTNIFQQAFGHCLQLSVIDVDVNNPAFASVDGILFDHSMGTLVVCPAGRVGTYEIPNSVTELAIYAFYQCRALTSIVIPEGVTTIGPSAFYGCSSLTNITLPDTVSTVGNGAFGAAGLISVTFPAGVAHVPDTAFFACYSLESVFFKGNAPSVGWNVFQSADDATVYYLLGTSGWTDSFAGRPTALWLPRLQVITTDATTMTNGFEFCIHWADGMVAVVETCTNLTSPVWSPLKTNTLPGDSSYFSDPAWTSHSTRLYRVSSP